MTNVIIFLGNWRGYLNAFFVLSGYTYRPVLEVPIPVLFLWYRHYENPFQNLYKRLEN